MKKYAFILKAEGAKPDTCSLTYRNDESLCIIAAAGKVQATEEYVKGLSGQGFYTIDLSGEFSDPELELISRAAGEKVSIRKALYDLNGLVRLDRLEASFLPKTQGIIIRAGGVEKAWEGVIRRRSGDVRVMIVRDIPQAKRAAVRMLEKRVCLIELSRWFDNLRLDAVVRAVDGAVPVGTCGKLFIYR